MHKKNLMTSCFAGPVIALSLFMLPTAPAAAAGTSLPVFADHPVTERFSGAPSLPDIKSAPEVKKFTSRIREGARQGPNFAGRYTIVDWGCGADCQSFVIVDAKTGAIHSPSITSSRGLLFRLDSSLLIVNPVAPGMLVDGKTPDWLVTGFYQWDVKKLTKIAEARNTIIDPQTGAARKSEPPAKMNIIDYINMTENSSLKIEKQEGVWKGQGDSGWFALKVADIANGYVEYDDAGYDNGAGSASYSAALFLDKDRQPLLAVLRVVRSTGTCPDPVYELTTFRMSGDRMAPAGDIVPALPLGLFLKKGFVPKKGDLYEFPGRFLKQGYKLPQKGTTLEAFLDAEDLACVLAVAGSEMKKQERDEREELLRNLRKEPVKLKWNKAQGVFEVQAGP